MNAIKVKNLSKTYITYKRGSSFKDVLKSLIIRKKVEVRALKGISFEVEEGELLGFLGPNGAGKSTTLKILTGILFPTSGEAEILGYIPWKQRRAYVANIGAVFGQKSQLIWDIPPMDSFEMNRAIYSIPACDYKKRLGMMVDLLGIPDVIDKPVRQLSLGERMKCEFIMAILHGPRVIFLDEPTIGLDVLAKEKIRDFILEMNRKGTTFILTTHDISDVEQMARRVMVVNNGEIVCDSSIGNLRGYFGNRKQVNISTVKPLPDFSTMCGITVTNGISSHNTELEVDIDKVELNLFIKHVNENCIISDITIGQPRIESVIREFYLNGASRERKGI